MIQQNMLDGEMEALAETELLERHVQAACIDHVRAFGAYARKLSSPANRSLPDYVITLDGYTWYVEFKRPGREPIPAQIEEHKKIAKASGIVWVIDDILEFKNRIAYLRETGYLFIPSPSDARP